MPISLKVTILRIILKTIKEKLRGAEPLRFLMSGVVFVLVALILLVTVLTVYFLTVNNLTVNNCCEGQLGVKFILKREARLISGKLCSSSGSNAWKRDRSVSISYEVLGTGAELTGEDFQNKGTFIVVRSSVFAQSSAQKTHSARDA
ncbi:hypothetical protein [uncultured Gimesia sp.]|uniref:hypothetical protein n=1 Tax=uncultured Gimesia sp. TaxID=1678688 RepID=UPI0026229F29|nr:hypothetical protein [uncultured Gimesia sp.]